MKSYYYKNHDFFCEDVQLESIAKKVGTPCYVYSYNYLKENFLSFKEAITSQASEPEPLICYSMKANSSKAILKTFIELGSGIDVVTVGELKRALEAGCPADRIVYSGVGKQDHEIMFALEVGILQFNVESEEELENIQKIASHVNKKAPIALRVNPDVDPKTHAYISTGMKKSKFGINHLEAVDLYKKAAKMSHIEIVGIDCHIGSQLTQVAPFVEAARRVRGLIDLLAKSGIHFKNLDFGGGVGIVYKDEKPPTPAEYAKAIMQEFSGLKLKFIFEPGRFLVGNSSVLLTKVIYNKIGEVKHFVIVDAAMNDLVRPAMYGAHHEIRPLNKDEVRPKKVVDVVGPICETGDFLVQDRELQHVSSGEYLALLSTGAYGFAMASNYNSRGRAAEVMVAGNEFFIIREREKEEELTRGEKLPPFMR